MTFDSLDEQRMLAYVPKPGWYVYPAVGWRFLYGPFDTKREADFAARLKTPTRVEYMCGSD